MKTHTSNFKTNISTMGRELDVKITYGNTTLDAESLYSVKPSFEGNILKSVMKELDIECETDISLNTSINLQIGVLVGSTYEYLNYGNYIVYSSEFKEDTKTYNIKCYDKMLYSMKEYEKLGVTYPITIKNYLSAICTKLGLTLKTTSFTNDSKTIPSECYLDSDGNSLGYTYRDVLDELAQVTASTICISSDDKLEIRYISNTSVDTIDGEMLKNTNVNFGEIQKPINVVTLSRSADSDIIHYPATLPTNPVEIKIKDNQILNGNNRSDFIQGIYNRLNGLTYSVNDFASTGICYLDLCDRYTIAIEQEDGTTNNYSCVLLNDEININQGLEETIHTELMEESTTDYTKSSTEDIFKNQTTLIVDKQNHQIEGIVEEVNQIEQEITTTNSQSGNNNLYLTNALESQVLSYEVKGNSYQNGTPTPTNKVDIDSIGNENLFDDNTNYIVGDYYLDNSGNAISSSGSWYSNKYIEVQPNTKYTLSSNDSVYRICYYNSSKTFISRISDTKNLVTFTTPSTCKYIRVSGNNYSYHIYDTYQIEKGTTPSKYRPYGTLPIEVVGKNLLTYPYYHTTSTIGSVTYTDNGDGSIKINGTSTSDSSLFYLTKALWSFNDELLVLQPGTYTFKSIGTNLAKLCINAYKSNGTNEFIAITTSDVTKTFTEKVTLNIRLQVTNGTTINNVTIYPQLEKGTQATDYEEYKSNQYNIDLLKENLFDKNDSIKENYNLGGDGSITYNSGLFVQEAYIQVQPNTQYTISTSVGGYKRIGQYTSEKVWISRLLSGASDTKYTFTTASNCYYIRLGCSIVDLDNLKLIIGNSDTYEICKIGDTIDTLDIDDLGNVTLTKRIGSVVLNGSETMNMRVAGMFGIKTPLSSYKTNANELVGIYCDRLSAKTRDAVYNGTIGICYGSSNSYYNDICLRVSTDITTIDTFKTWLSSNNVKVDYILQEPYTIDLGTIDISLFENINHINLLDTLDTDTSVSYLTNTTLNGTYVSESKFNMTKNEIDLSVESSVTDLSKQIEDLDTNVNKTISSLSVKTDGIYQSVTDINTELGKTTEQVKNMSSEFTTNGLRILSSQSDFNALFNNEGVQVYNRDTLTAIFNQNGSGVNKLIVVQEMQLQNLLVKPRTTTINGTDKKVISFFWNNNLISTLNDLKGGNQ